MDSIRTKRLVLRRFAESDLADVLAYQRHPETLRYLPTEPMTEEKAVRFLARQADPDTWAGRGWQAWAVVLPGENRVIGEVGIFLPEPPKSEGDLGWMLHPDYQGRGYATETAQALVRHAFEERGLHRLTSGCDTRNAPSWRLMERLGMQREAHYRQSQWVQGAWRDEYIYALLREEDK